MAEGEAEMDNFYIQLSNNPVRFEPVSKVTNVFFDDANRQVCQCQIAKNNLYSLAGLKIISHLFTYFNFIFSPCILVLS